jgi:hypothetical protein
MKGEGRRLVPEWFLQLTRTGTIYVPVLMKKNMHLLHPHYSSSEGSGSMLNRSEGQKEKLEPFLQVRN